MSMKNKWKRAFALTLAAMMTAGTVTGCGSAGAGSSESSSGEEAGTLRVGSKDFTENEIVAEVYALALEKAGFEVERTFDIGSALIHTSITNDEIDLYPEYTGTGLITVLGEAPMTDGQEVYDKVKAEYAEQYNITWLDYSEANDGQGLVIRTEVAENFDIASISDLQKAAEELRFASPGEFDEREDGRPALEAVYGPFEWKSSKVYDNALKYEVLSNDEADVAPAYTTEGRLTDPQFTLLEDDKHVWPPYNLAPIVRTEVLDEHKEISDVLNKVSAAFTTENITALNARVDIDGEEYEDVARDFFEENIQ